MKEVFRSSDTARMGLFQSILDDAEIPYFVRNDSTQQMVVGGIMAALLPIPEFWPALCVLKDEDYPKAMRLLREAGEAPPEGSEWKCPSCGEVIPGNFTSCWNCQEPRPSADTPA